MLAGNKGGEEEIMKERERKWGLYKGMEMNIIMLPFLSKQKRRTNETCVSILMKSASRQTKLDAEISSASKKEKCKIALGRKDKKAWLIRFRIDLAGQALNAVWRGSLH